MYAHGIDIGRQLFVIDQNANARSVRNARGQHIESEVQGAIFGDIVVRTRIWSRETRDPMAIVSLDDRTETATVASIGPVGSEVIIEVMGCRRMSDEGRRRVIEEIAQRRTAMADHQYVISRNGFA